MIQRFLAQDAFVRIKRIFLVLLCVIRPAFCETKLKKSLRKPSVGFVCRSYFKNATEFLGREAWESAKIVAFVIAASAAYGIAHDQVTSRICLEYFSEGFHRHNVSYWPNTGILGMAKPILQTTKSPTVTACIWGPIATFHAGLFSGSLLALVSRFGEKDQYTAKKLRKPVGVALGVTGLCSAVALMFPQTQYATGESRFMEGVPAEKRIAFLRCLSAHETAYTMGAITTVVAAIWILYQRLKVAEDANEKEQLSEKIKTVKSKALRRNLSR